MPPKKKEAKKGPEETGPGEDPDVVKVNYIKFAKLLGVTPSRQVITQFEDTESETNYPPTQLVIDNDLGEFPVGGARALCTALLGTGTGMSGGVYKLLNSLRIWRCNLGDQGCNAVAELLRLGGGEMKIQYLELLDNLIGPNGCYALGRSLSKGNNRSLITLKLDYNGTIGSQGVIELCNGLRTNSSLKNIHLSYCNIDEEAGPALGDLVTYTKCGIVTLNLMGNRLRGPGIAAIARGLPQAPSLEYLGLADNAITSDTDNLQALQIFADAFVQAPKLAHIDLLYNRIGEEGAEILRPSLTPANTNIKTFLVDSTLPTPLFEAIHRKEGGGKKGKGKGKGKKKGK